jgi:hypothetical protein
LAVIPGAVSPFEKEKNQVRMPYVPKRQQIDSHFRPVAHEIATVLNSFPEELFSTHPIDIAAESFDNSYGHLSPLAVGIHFGNYQEARSPIEIIH